jgi:hypothetical protein
MKKMKFPLLPNVMRSTRVAALGLSECTETTVGKLFSPGLHPLLLAVETIPVHTADCERRLRQTNLILSPVRNSQAVINCLLPVVWQARWSSSRAVQTRAIRNVMAGSGEAQCGRQQ